MKLHRQNFPFSGQEKCFRSATKSTQNVLLTGCVAPAAFKGRIFQLIARLSFLLLGLTARPIYALTECYYSGTSEDIVKADLNGLKHTCEETKGSTFYGSYVKVSKCVASSGVTIDDSTKVWQLNYSCNSCTSDEVKKEVESFQKECASQCKKTDYVCSWTNGEWGHSFPLPKVCGSKDDSLEGCSESSSSTAVSSSSVAVNSSSSGEGGTGESSSSGWSLSSGSGDGSSGSGASSGSGDGCTGNYCGSDTASAGGSGAYGYIDELEVCKGSRWQSVFPASFSAASCTQNKTFDISSGDFSKTFPDGLFKSRPAYSDPENFYYEYQSNGFGCQYNRFLDGRVWAVVLTNMGYVTSSNYKSLTFRCYERDDCNAHQIGYYKEETIELGAESWECALDNTADVNGCKLLSSVNGSTAVSILISWNGSSWDLATYLREIGSNGYELAQRILDDKEVMAKVSECMADTSEYYSSSSEVGFSSSSWEIDWSSDSESGTSSSSGGSVSRSSDSGESWYSSGSESGGESTSGSSSKSSGSSGGGGSGGSGSGGSGSEDVSSSSVSTADFLSSFDATHSYGEIDTTGGKAGDYALRGDVFKVLEKLKKFYEMVKDGFKETIGLGGKTADNTTEIVEILKEIKQVTIDSSGSKSSSSKERSSSSARSSSSERFGCTWIQCPTDGTCFCREWKESSSGKTDTTRTDTTRTESVNTTDSLTLRQLVALTDSLRRWTAGDTAAMKTIDTALASIAYGGGWCTDNIKGIIPNQGTSLLCGSMGNGEFAAYIRKLDTLAAVSGKLSGLLAQNSDLNDKTNSKIEDLKNQMSGLMSEISYFGTDIEDVVSGVVGNQTNVMGNIGSALDDGLKGIADSLHGGFGGLGDSLSRGFAGLGGKLDSLGSGGLGDGVGDSLGSLHGSVRGILDTLGASFEGDTSGFDMDSLGAWYSSASASADSGRVFDSDSLWLDTSKFESKYRKMYLSNTYSTTSNSCYTFYMDSVKVFNTHFGGVNIDFSNVGGFDLCGVGRGVSRFGAFLLCMLMMFGAWKGAFKGGD